MTVPLKMPLTPRPIPLLASESVENVAMNICSVSSHLTQIALGFHTWVEIVAGGKGVD